MKNKKLLTFGAFTLLIGICLFAINLLYLKKLNLQLRIKNKKLVIKVVRDHSNSIHDYDVEHFKHFNALEHSKSYFNRFNIRKPRNESLKKSSYSIKCSMSSCFDWSKCQKSLKIYIYKEPVIIKSNIFNKILKALSGLKDYITTNRNEACLFILAIDTLDRDKLSADYVKDLNDVISLNILDAHWNDGENHLIFNHYSGSWPKYIDNLQMNTSKAILVKASFSNRSYRKNFDISFPLFHSDLPLYDAEPNIFNNKNDNHYIFGEKKYLLTFKGKRYLHGVGSEVRNSVYHLNNKRDVLLLTTCKHGLKWQELKDERCDIDNALYEMYDYNTLLNDSTFCLVPRGRRLATYRFLEAIKYGCIPVLLSNSWVLPFSEVLDWNKAVIWGDERMISQIPFMLREISFERIVRMRQYGLFFYREYFSSVNRIAKTTIKIIEERVIKEKIRPSIVWNEYPGAYYYDKSYSNNLLDYPFYHQSLKIKYNEEFINKNNYCQMLLICDPKQSFKQREHKLKLFIDFLNSDKNKLNFFIESLIFIDCFNDANVTIEHMFKNIKFNIRIKEMKYDDNHIFFKELEEIARSYLNDKNCLITMDENMSSQVTIENLQLGFKLWNENSDNLIGISAFNNREFNFNFINLELAFVHRYYLYTILSQAEKFNSHDNSINSISDYFFNHITKMVNLFILKLTLKQPIKIKISINKYFSNLMSSNMTNLAQVFFRFDNYSKLNEYFLNEFTISNFSFL